jgi:hypothetical protein
VALREQLHFVAFGEDFQVMLAERAGDGAKVGNRRPRLLEGPQTGASNQVGSCFASWQGLQARCGVGLCCASRQIESMRPVPSRGTAGEGGVLRGLAEAKGRRQPGLDGGLGEGRGRAPPWLPFHTPAATAPRGSAGADFFRATKPEIRERFGFTVCCTGPVRLFST